MGLRDELVSSVCITAMNATAGILYLSFIMVGALIQELYSYTCIASMLCVCNRQFGIRYCSNYYYQHKNRNIWKSMNFSYQLKLQYIQIKASNGVQVKHIFCTLPYSLWGKEMKKSKKTRKSWIILPGRALNLWHWIIIIITYAKNTISENDNDNNNNMTQHRLLPYHYSAEWQMIL